MLSNLLININRKFVYALLLVLFFTTACGQQKEVYQDSLKQDVLVAQDCGLSGLTCCFNKEKKCESGLECCISPSDPNNGYCGETCDDGKLNKYCRKAEPKCDDSAVCVNDYCVQCGVTGNPCCGGNKCADQDKKDISHAECMNTVCTLCGNSDQASCAGDYKCAAGNLDNGGMCLKCGGLNQPCCAGENTCNKDMKCQLGFCS